MLIDGPSMGLAAERILQNSLVPLGGGSNGPVIIAVVDAAVAQLRAPPILPTDSGIKEG